VGRSPAKILLCGEHAAVYGMPAIAMAVNRFATTEIRHGKGLSVLLTLCDIKKTCRVTVSTLRSVKQRLYYAYKKFVGGSMGIREVLSSPSDLFQFALISLLDSCALELKSGLDIRLQSTIPIGCGMGSSAATTVSFVRGLVRYFSLEKGLDWVENLIGEVEQMQHGRSSGVDAHICLHGGCIRFQKGNDSVPLPLPRIPMWLVHTGCPESTTGECVVTVGKVFRYSEIWSEFGDISLQFAHALRHDQTKIAAIVSENHALLNRIGVVPERVASFVKDVERGGGAAKICGSGAVHGEAGGIVLVVQNSPPKELCDRYHYNFFPLEGETLGATAYSH
jgi:mevalonate kinase